MKRLSQSLGNPWIVTVVGGTASTLLALVVQQAASRIGTGIFWGNWPWWTYLLVFATGVAVTAAIFFFSRGPRPDSPYIIERQVVTYRIVSATEYLQVVDLTLIAGTESVHEVKSGYSWSGDGEVDEQSLTDGVSSVDVDEPGPYRRKAARFVDPVRPGGRRDYRILRTCRAVKRPPDPYLRLDLGDKPVRELVLTVIFPSGGFPKEAIFRALASDGSGVGDPERLPDGSVIGIARKSITNPAPRGAYIISWK